MSDKESNDEIQVISERLQTATTIDSTCNNSQQHQQQEKSSRKSSNNQSVEGKKLCPATTGTGTTSTTTSNTTIEDYVQVRNVPELNLPEKIVLVVDTVREQQCTPFKLGTGATFSPLCMIKRVVENFVGAKSTIQPGVHEYALMSLDSRGASWLCDYTSNAKTLVGHLENVVEDSPDEEQRTCDLDQLFEAIHAKIATPTTSQPLFVSRVILIYGRSNSIPKFHTGQKYLENLTENPYFFLDVLFVHEPASEDNLCEAVYAEIAALDTTSYSYIFEVGRNAAKLHDNMAKLLAHPLQRPLQKDAFYTFVSNTTAQEVSKLNDTTLQADGELVLSSESASTDLTREGLNPRMRPLMPDKIRDVRELLLTLDAGVWLLTGVLPPVLVQISRMMEGLLTEIAR